MDNGSVSNAKLGNSVKTRVYTAMEESVLHTYTYNMPCHHILPSWIATTLASILVFRSDEVRLKLQRPLIFLNLHLGKGSTSIATITHSPLPHMLYAMLLASQCVIDKYIEIRIYTSMQYTYIHAS